MPVLRLSDHPPHSSVCAPARDAPAGEIAEALEGESMSGCYVQGEGCNEDADNAESAGGGWFFHEMHGFGQFGWFLGARGVVGSARQHG